MRLPFEFLPYLTTLPSHTHISTLTVKPIKFYNQANLSPLFKEHDLTAKVLNMKSFKTLCTFSKIINFFTTPINLLYKPFNFILFEISVFFFFFWYKQQNNFPIKISLTHQSTWHISQTQTMNNTNNHNTNNILYIYYNT